MLSFQSGSNTVPLRITGWVAFSFKTTHAWVLCVTAATAFAGQSPFDTGPPPPWWLTPLQQYPANASESWVWQALHWPPFSWHSPQQIELGSSTHFCSKRLFFFPKTDYKDKSSIRKMADFYWLLIWNIDFTFLLFDHTWMNRSCHCGDGICWTITIGYCSIASEVIGATTAISSNCIGISIRTGWALTTLIIASAPTHGCGIFYPFKGDWVQED